VAGRPSAEVVFLRERGGFYNAGEIAARTGRTEDEVIANLRKGEAAGLLEHREYKQLRAKPNQQPGHEAMTKVLVEQWRAVK
jgi:predicted transcriptional regulator